MPRKCVTCKRHVCDLCATKVCEEMRDSMLKMFGDEDFTRGVDMFAIAKVLVDFEPLISPSDTGEFVYKMLHLSSKDVNAHYSALESFHATNACDAAVAYVRLVLAEKPPPAPAVESMSLDTAEMPRGCHE